MTIQEYRAHPAENFSKLKFLLTSIPHYIAARRAEDRPTEAMKIGTMLHKWWLEGIEPDVVVKPEGMSFATKEGKEWRAENKGKTIMDGDEYLQLVHRVMKLNESKLACSIRDAMTSIEQPLFAEIEGVPVKALFDGVNNVAFMDLKTCQENCPREWGEQVMNYCYPLQFAIYESVWKANYGKRRRPKFWWITVSDERSPVVAVYDIHPFAELGREQLALVLKRYRYWQAMGEQPIHAEMPYWAVKEVAA